MDTRDRKEEKKAYYELNKDSIKRKHKEEYDKNAPKKREAANKYYGLTKEKFKDRRNKSGRESYMRHKEKRNKYATESIAKNRKEWIKILTDLDMTTCKHCGYNIDFIGIDFHHVKAKEKQPSHTMALKPTPERIEEIKGCIPLCAICHRIEHRNIKRRNDMMNSSTGY